MKNLLLQKRRIKGEEIDKLFSMKGKNILSIGDTKGELISYIRSKYPATKLIIYNGSRKFKRNTVVENVDFAILEACNANRWISTIMEENNIPYVAEICCRSSSINGNNLYLKRSEIITVNNKKYKIIPKI